MLQLVNMSVVLASALALFLRSPSDKPPCHFSSSRPSQEQQRLAGRRQTDQQQQLFQLRSIKTAIKHQDDRTKARQQLRKAKQEAQKAQPRRLGKLKYMSNSPPT